MRIEVWGLALALSSAAAAACGDEANRCSHPADCADGQSCVWAGGYRCYTKCDIDDDCGADETCEPAAASCKHCPDILSVCR